MPVFISIFFTTTCRAQAVVSPFPRSVGEVAVFRRLPAGVQRGLGEGVDWEDSELIESA